MGKSVSCPEPQFPHLQTLGAELGDAKSPFHLEGVGTGGEDETSPSLKTQICLLLTKNHSTTDSKQTMGHKVSQCLVAAHILTFIAMDKCKKD